MNSGKLNSKHLEPSIISNKRKSQSQICIRPSKILLDPVQSNEAKFESASKNMIEINLNFLKTRTHRSSVKINYSNDENSYLITSEIYIPRRDVKAKSCGFISQLNLSNYYHYHFPSPTQKKSIITKHNLPHKELCNPLEVKNTNKNSKNVTFNEDITNSFPRNNVRNVTTPLKCIKNVFSEEQSSPQKLINHLSQSNLQFNHLTPTKSTIQRKTSSQSDKVPSNFSSPDKNDSDFHKKITLYIKNHYKFDPNNLTINQLRYYVIPFCREQYGCRYLQMMIEKSPSVAKDLIFNQVLNDLKSIVNDRFGNYLIQKLIMILEYEDFLKMIEELSDNLILTACNFYGTRVIQHLLSVLRPYCDLYRSIFMNIIKIFHRLCIDPYGTHIIGKIMALAEEEEMKILIEITLLKLDSLSSDKFGCCIIQKLLEKTRFENLNLMSRILDYTCQFIIDAFAYYVILYIIKQGNQDFNMIIVDKILPRIFYYSKVKYASNVIEKLLEVSNPPITNIMLSKMLENPNEVKNLLFDLNGNYGNLLLLSFF